MYDVKDHTLNNVIAGDGINVLNSRKNMTETETDCSGLFLNGAVNNILELM